MVLNNLWFKHYDQKQDINITLIIKNVFKLTIFYDLFQLSYADTNPLLSDRSTFPYFFRTVPSDSDFNPARIQLLRQFNWTRVGTLFQDASHGSSRFAYVSLFYLLGSI